MTERPRLLLVPQLPHLEWLIRPQLEEWAEAIGPLAEEAENAYAMFNNNGRSPSPPGLAEREWFAQAPVNALRFKELLGQEVPA